MTKTTLLTATALAALAFAGAANAQVITDVTISGQSRAQLTAFNVTSGAASTFTNTTTALAATPAAVAGAQYLVATESQPLLANRTTTSATSTTGRYIGTSAAAGSQTLGLLGGNTYQITFTLSGGSGVNPRFASSVPATAFTLLDGTGAALGAASATQCDTTDLSTPTVVAGGAAGDTSVTIQFTVGATVATNCDGLTDLNSSIGGVTVTHPFLVDTFGTVGVALNTVLTVGTHANFADTIGTAAQRTRSTVVNAVSGYNFTAGNVVGAANGASATGAGFSDGVDRLLLGTVAPPFRTFQANDGISQVNFGAVAQAAGVAYAGLNAQALPAVTYDLRVNALNNPFGTTVDSLRPGTSGAAGNPVGTYAVAAGGASASLTGLNAATTTFINQGAAGTPTVSLATVDQAYTVTVTPATASAGLITAPAARTYTAGSLVLEGTSFRAPWMNSSVTGYNTVLRISNSASRAIGPVELSLTSPATATATSSTVCRVATAPTLGSIAAGGELSINSATLTACFGEFRRGDVTVRILDTVPAGSLAAKLRIVNPGGVISEQSLGAFSGNELANAPF